MIRYFVLLTLLLGASAHVFVAQEPAEAPQYKSNLPADDPAVQYGRGVINDAASRLASALDSGPNGLSSTGPSRGVLPALLKRFQINSDSQMLVFSKTSFQAARISPSHPRAIYFGDDVMVAYVPGAPTLEIVALDPAQGPMFYTMPIGGGRPSLARGQTCLRCHQGPNTAGVPGIYVGSVIPGPTGAPLRDESAIVTDHRSPFAGRWGGWYVTARRGEARDRANAVASNPADPSALVRESRQNLSSLNGLFDASGYVAPTSDIVALMTFEHQTQMTNLITRVGWEARILAPEIARRRQPSDAAPGDVARRLQPTLRRGSGSAPSSAEGPRDQSGVSVNVTAAMLDADIEDLVTYMLFSGEAPLKEPIEGVSAFTRTFQERGPKDHLGRSLRDFDLKTRLFRYPLSYMIYSASFDALPAGARDRIYRRLFDVLSGADRSPAFVHLSEADRRAIVEILRDTKRALPGYFGETTSG